MESENQPKPASKSEPVRAMLGTFSDFMGDAAMSLQGMQTRFDDVLKDCEAERAAHEATKRELEASRDMVLNHTERDRLRAEVEQLRGELAEAREALSRSALLPVPELPKDVEGLLWDNVGHVVQFPRGQSAFLSAGASNGECASVLVHQHNAAIRTLAARLKAEGAAGDDGPLRVLAAYKRAWRLVVDGDATIYGDTFVTEKAEKILAEELARPVEPPRAKRWLVVDNGESVGFFPSKDEADERARVLREFVQVVEVSDE